jgi:hypothetical protein
VNPVPSSGPGRPDVATSTRDALQQAHPGWLILHDTATGMWSAYRRAFPGEREIAAGAGPLVRAATAELLKERLTAQAELLAASPRWKLFGLLRSFLRS